MLSAWVLARACDGACRYANVWRCLQPQCSAVEGDPGLGIYLDTTAPAYWNAAAEALVLNRGLPPQARVEVSGPAATSHRCPSHCGTSRTRVPRTCSLLRNGR